MARCQVLPDFVAKQGGRAYGLVACAELSRFCLRKWWLRLLGRAEENAR